jgi:ankyrin repeat protein
VGGLKATAAHWAAANHHADTLRQLVCGWGADAGLLTATGCLPLHSAAAAGRIETVKLFLHALLPAATLQQQLAAANEDGHTPAVLAGRHGHKLVQGMLLQAAAAGGATSDTPDVARTRGQPDGNAAGQHGSQDQLPPPVAPQQPGMRKGFLLGAASTSGSGGTQTGSSGAGGQQTASEVAGQPVVKAAADAGGSSGAVAACATCAPQQEPQQQQEGRREQPQQQQAAIAVPNDAAPTAPEPAPAALPPPQPAMERSVGRAWLDAARAGDVAALRALLAAHPSLLAYSGTGTSYAFTGNSALHWAAAKGHARVAAWLLQQGSCPREHPHAGAAATTSAGAPPTRQQLCAARNQAGATALHTAVEHGQWGAARVVVLAGAADVTAVDGLGQTPLSMSSSSAGGSRALELQMWAHAAELQATRARPWHVCDMQRLLALAGRQGHAAACLERSELQELCVQVLADVHRAAGLAE